MTKRYSAVIPAVLSEENGTRSENYGTTEFTGNITFIGPWMGRNEVMAVLRHTVFPVTSDNVISYYGYYQPAFVQSISVQPVGLEGTHIITDYHTPLQPYTRAKYAVQYKGMTRPGNSTVQEQVTPSCHMRQIPSFGYYWYSDGAPVLDQEAPAVRGMMMSITRTISGVRVLPDFFFNLAGCVNSEAWHDAVLGRTFLPGTLLFIPSNIDRQMTFANDNDDYLWTFAYTLEWSPIGWNNFQRPHGVDTMMYSYPVFKKKWVASARKYIKVLDDWVGVPVQLYPAVPFPSMIFDPNDPDVSEWLMEEFYVDGIDYDGIMFEAYVDNFGAVTVTKAIV